MCNAGKSFFRGKELTDLKEIQEKLFVQLMLEIRRCIDDPGTCNCEEVLDGAEASTFRKLVAADCACCSVNGALVLGKTIAPYIKQKWVLSTLRLFYLPVNFRLLLCFLGPLTLRS